MSVGSEELRQADTCPERFRPQPPQVGGRCRVGTTRLVCEPPDAEPVEIAREPVPADDLSKVRTIVDESVEI